MPTVTKPTKYLKPWELYEKLSAHWAEVAGKAQSADLRKHARRKAEEMRDRAIVLWRASEDCPRTRKAA